MTSTTFTLGDDVKVEITVTETGTGDLLFTLKVDESAGMTADLNAIFFDLADDSITSGLTAMGTDVTDDKMIADKVTKIDSFTNMNGEVINELGRFDGGVQFGTSGIAQDDIQETSFVLSHDTIDLTIADIMGQDFGIRLTSVGEIDGSRDGSVKIGGTAPDTPDNTDPVLQNTANNDVMFVDADEIFEINGSTDQLSGGARSVLENDTSFDGTDSFVYNGNVTAVNGDDAAVAQVVAGSDGGLLIINADGTVDFSANGEFDDLGLFETATTQFTYGIEGGSTATVDVVVSGIDEGFENGF